MYSVYTYKYMVLSRRVFFIFLDDTQEAPVLVTFGRQLSNTFTNFIIGILRLRAIDWYINEFNRRRSGGGGVSGGVRLFGTPPPEFYWGVFPNL